MKTLLVILAGLSLAVAVGDDSSVKNIAGAAAEKTTVVAAATGAVTAPPHSDDVRDVLLMLDESPLHLRFHLSVGGISPTVARQAYVERLMKSLDTDGDGKLS